ncbi:solute carrier families 5 and 6-like protein [Azobacteroides phage ProJPt-Bp1]|uniref:Solute carrier families 5 and 6-like protein n=1 Tax=Azobacteroides phage ProJPt-Bp1 TaxID=1920526 RepID=A0A1V1G1W6_9CAUD|nr:solute carrier families 5 and 6-like protein [Azobacteroides phage ProJPt-Bp1]BAX03453.1 solute carrier families 5 and 6-like protein [Azobacteroides phage ProJPt-Bp1]
MKRIFVQDDAKDLIKKNGIYTVYTDRKLAAVLLVHAASGSADPPQIIQYLIDESVNPVTAKRRYVDQNGNWTEWTNYSFAVVPPPPPPPPGKKETKRIPISNGHKGDKVKGKPVQ